MFSLQKLNVVRIVETEVEKSKLIDKGFKLLEEIKEKAEGDNTPKADDSKGKATK